MAIFVANNKAKGSIYDNLYFAKEYLLQNSKKICPIVPILMSNYFQVSNRVFLQDITSKWKFVLEEPPRVFDYPFAMVTFMQFPEISNFTILSM